MKRRGSLRTLYFNNKAQSLTEMAAFGSVLLLVFSVLFRYGMLYNYEMDLKTRTFRQAMFEAYNNTNIDASSRVIALEDKHIPDPTNSFGIGEVTPIEAGSDFMWGNTLEKITDPVLPREEMPRITYMINPEGFEDANKNGYFDAEPLTCDESCVGVCRDHDFLAFSPENTLRRESFTDTNGNGIWDHESWDGEGTFTPDGKHYGPYYENYCPNCDKDGDGVYDYSDPEIMLTCPGGCAADNGNTGLGFSVLEWMGNGQWDHTFVDSDNNHAWTHEPFADADGDGYLDQDPFEDLNGNGIWDSEVFDDVDGNGARDGVVMYNNMYYDEISSSTVLYGIVSTGELKPIAWDRLRIYRADENEFVRPQVMYLTDDFQIDILTEACTGGDKCVPRMIVMPLPEDGTHGDAVTGLVISTPETAEINAELFEENLNADLNGDNIPDVNLANRQGLITDSTQSISSQASTKLEESPASTKSTDKIDASTKIKHTIKKNIGPDDNFIFTIDMGKGMNNKVWNTPK